MNVMPVLRTLPLTVADRLAASNRARPGASRCLAVSQHCLFRSQINQSHLWPRIRLLLLYFSLKILHLILLQPESFNLQG